ncbi:MAG: dipicolinate synthase subunit DpsA [Dethiobacteria bacterium]
MISKLNKLNIIICGGDSRELELYKILREKGLNIKMAGFGKIHDIPAVDQVALENLSGIDVLILPIWGIDERGRVSSRFNHTINSRKGFLPESYPEKSTSYHIEPLLLDYEGKNLLVLTGSVNEKLRRQVLPTVRFAITLSDEEFMQLNSIPTAEGAIMKAMEVSPSTIHSSRVLVLGLGRCGITLCLMLKGLGARVTAVVRRAESRAMAVSLNIEGILFDDLDSALPHADLIFNTVPALVLPRSALQLINGETQIFDIASYPGGVDLEAARSLNLEVFVLPGLPGKVAPKKAGEILARVYPRLIHTHYEFINS